MGIDSLLKSIRDADLGVVNAWEDLESDTPWINPSKKPVIHTVPYDVLAASHALFRLYNDDPEANGSRGYKRWMELDDPEIANLITPQDQAMANTIRDYYGKQLMVSRLKDEREFSPYMKCLAKIVSESGNQYTKDERGAIYRLPEYYQYDVTWDKMVEENFNDYSTQDLLVRERSLKPVKRLMRLNRGEKVIELWFKDIKSSQPVKLSVAVSNPLGYIVETLFDRGNPFKISTTKPVESIRRGSKFMTTDKWKIINLDEL
jgi:hypothetical protein